MLVAQFYPSRLSISHTRPPQTMTALLDKMINKAIPDTTKQRYEANFAVQNNPFALSKASKRKLFDSVNSMFCLSQPRQIKMKNNKILPNFRLAFVTLTLPAGQMHPDTFIKSECLNHFLVELRKFYNVKNYVWKAELQKNENIHFHLITDQYLDYQALRRRWNRILSKHGYISAYSERFSKMSLTDYHNLRNKSDKCDFHISAKAYAAGQKSKWSNPNTVDVRKVRDKKDLAIYLAKYISKPIEETEPDAELTERQINFGRSWSRSYSLAQLKYINKFTLDEISNIYKYLRSVPDKVKRYADEWCEVFYFNVSELAQWFQRFHRLIITENAKMYNYPIPYQ